MCVTYHIIKLGVSRYYTKDETGVCGCIMLYCRMIANVYIITYNRYVYIVVPCCKEHIKRIHTSYSRNINVNVVSIRSLARSIHYIMHQLIEILQKARPEVPLYCKKCLLENAQNRSNQLDQKRVSIWSGAGSLTVVEKQFRDVVKNPKLANLL